MKLSKFALLIIFILPSFSFSSKKRDEFEIYKMVLSLYVSGDYFDVVTSTRFVKNPDLAKRLTQDFEPHKKRNCTSLHQKNLTQRLEDVLKNQKYYPKRSMSPLEKIKIIIATAPKILKNQIGFQKISLQTIHKCLFDAFDLMVSDHASPYFEMYTSVTKMSDFSKLLDRRNLLNSLEIYRIGTSQIEKISKESPFFTGLDVNYKKHTTYNQNLLTNIFRYFIEKDERYLIPFYQWNYFGNRYKYEDYFDEVKIITKKGITEWFFDLRLSEVLYYFISVRKFSSISVRRKIDSTIENFLDKYINPKIKNIRYQTGNIEPLSQRKEEPLSKKIDLSEVPNIIKIYGTEKIDRALRIRLRPAVVSTFEMYEDQDWYDVCWVYLYES